MPTGWATDRAATDNEGKLVYAPTKCENIVNLQTGVSTELASASFSEAGMLGSSLSQTIYKIRAKPTSYRLALAREALKKCRSYKLRFAEESEIHHLSPVSFPDLGEGTVAIRDNVDEADGGNYVTDSIFVAIRGVNMRFDSTGTSTPLTGQALARLIKLALHRAVH